MAARVWMYQPATSMANTPRGTMNPVSKRASLFAARFACRYGMCRTSPASGFWLKHRRSDYLRMALHPLGLRRCIVNWDEVVRHVMRRAEHELGRLAGDE